LPPRSKRRNLATSCGELRIEEQGVPMAVKRRALVMYGRGGSLGNFKFFADDLVTTELSGYPRADVAIENVERRDAFFAVLNRHPASSRNCTSSRTPSEAACSLRMETQSREPRGRLGL
jgi:hypothetical protein